MYANRMSFLHRNGLMLRGIAVFLTAYCVLASGRALVPGLCATLADLNAEADACCQPKPSCCHDDTDAAGAAAITTAPHPCAFCNLVHTAAHPIALAKCSAPEFNAPRFIAAHDDYAADPTSADCFLRRAPPLA